MHEYGGLFGGRTYPPRSVLRYTVALMEPHVDALLEAGFRYASVSNSDNLGAVPNARIAGWFAASGAKIMLKDWITNT